MSDPNALSPIDKAAILHEALPYIRRFRGETFVLKYGGHAMSEKVLRESFAQDVVLMKYVGIHPVIVHGGGPQIDAVLGQMGIISERKRGLRITDRATMSVAEMVLRGSITPEIVALIGHHGGRAVGVSGHDDSFFRATKMAPIDTEEGPIDLGFVGTPTSVDPDLIRRLSQAGFIPVIAPIAIDEAGGSLNVNADTAAAEIAIALGARKLVLMTDVEGVKDERGALRRSLSAQEVEALKGAGAISGGMLPKVECALHAIGGGVQKAHIVDGRMQHVNLLEFFTDQGVGTELIATREEGDPPIAAGA